ncbi:MAG: hypothetical protein ACRDLT_11815 [Solirubrobacteraceae bacterium]
MIKVLEPLRLFVLPPDRRRIGAEKVKGAAVEIQPEGIQPKRSRPGIG